MTAPLAPRKSKNRMVWIDCEMTGLDPERHVLLEIATIVTDWDLNILEMGPELAIRQSEEVLAGIDTWSRETHTKSGLLERVRGEGVPIDEAERRTLEFVQRHCVVRTAPLCGNSIGQDKRFLVKYMPALHDYLHYRVVDESTIKQLASRWYGDRFTPPAKQELHRALADIVESIDELKFYRAHVFVPPMPAVAPATTP